MKSWGGMKNQPAHNIKSLFITELFVITALLLWQSHAQAITVSESFTSFAHRDSAGGMVWNIGLGTLHPPVRVDDWDDGLGAQDTNFDAGDGRHGAFIPSRYAQFDNDGVVTGGVIEINTNTYSNLQFTVFNLASGYTIRPVGSAPLVIRVLSTVQIDGQINCSGENGASATNDVNAVRAGGSAHCGGGAGGASVAAGVAPAAINQGASAATGTTGGVGGPICLATGGQGGGGGGALVRPVGMGGSKPDPTDGDDSVGGSGGTAGTIAPDDSFSVDVDGAGAGGGGGSAFDDVGDPGNHMSGAGGGAGGGNIRIYAIGDITVSATGSIVANGGNGGSSFVGKGGAGGGGAGGSILIFTPGDIVFDGTVTASPGSGGASAGGIGGTGAWGRTWIVEKDITAGGSIVEDPQSQLNVQGTVLYETGITYTITSTAIDLGNTKPTPTALPITINIPGVVPTVNTYEIAFSDSPDLSTLTNFALPATYLNAEQKRYARIRIQIDNQDAVAPTTISDLSFIFDGREESEFNFKTSCATVGGSNSRPPQSYWAMVLVIFFTPLMFCLVLRKKISESQ